MQPFAPHLDGCYLVQHQMAEDLRRRAAEFLRRREQQKAAIRSVRQFAAYRARFRRAFLDAIGGLPSPRSPLRARVTGTLPQPNFTIEKILFESLPDFLVTAACYVPRRLASRAPAVVFVCGHLADGKQDPEYQAVCVDLVRNGFVVLALDPIGQGERAQLLSRGRPTFPYCTMEHTHAGLPFVLKGANIARHFIWDVMRGIDYLETRPDVDPGRIGITGNSGGGTQTCYLMLMEPRLAAAVPCTFVTTLEHILQTGLPQDAEQILHNALVTGPDHDDFLAAFAPKPVLVGAVASDFFPIEGTLLAVQRARRIYALLGQPNNLDLVIDPNATHTYSPGLRQACVSWFCRHLLGRKPTFLSSPPVRIPPAALRATKSGQVLVDFPRSRTIFDLGRALLPAPLPARPSAAAWRERLARALGVNQAGSRRAAIHARVLPQPAVGGYRVEHLFFFSAPAIVVAGILIHPRGARPTHRLPATLLLLENGTGDVVRERPRIRRWLRAGHRVLVFDPRGIGAVRARAVSVYEEGEFNLFGNEYKLGCDASLLGLSTVGLRVFDVLRAFDYLRSRADVEQVHVHGVGSGAVFAYLAAALEPGFASVTAEDMLYSYRALCDTPHFDHDRYHYKTLAWGILRHGDLVDVLRCLRPRPVRFVQPRDPLGRPVSRTEWEQRFLRQARRLGVLQGGWQPQVVFGTDRRRQY